MYRSSNGKKQERAPLTTAAAVKSAALGYLSVRYYSYKELRDKLKKRGAADSHIEEAVNYLKERNYLDEGKLSEAYIHSRAELSLEGPLRVKQGLVRRGIDDELIGAAMEAYYGEDLQRLVCRAFLEKQLRLCRFADSLHDKKECRKLKNKIYAKALNRGFSSGMALSVLNALVARFSEDMNCNIYEADDEL